jgi:DNA-binding protein Fis
MTVRLPANLAWLEARAIDAALQATGGNQRRAAALLGINRVTLYKKLKREVDS